MIRRDRLPLTYEESRARFRYGAARAGAPVATHPIAARGPFGQELTIDVARVGPRQPHRALVLLSGVHGVEGFVNAEVQAELLLRLAGADVDLPDDVGIVLVHAVNPWGMAHDRRQNESNVDLNRNWMRDDIEPAQNQAYDEVHHLACPDTPDLPTPDDLFTSLAPVLADRGEAWIRDAITKGQYSRPDGLHYGGATTEESNAILQSELPPLLQRAEKVLTVDLHTGHGPRGEIVLLSSQPPGSPQDDFLRAAFGDVEATAGNPDATTGVKSGQIASGLSMLLPDALCHAVVIEVGTANTIEQLIATYQEQWVHRRGDLSIPEHAAARARYRDCFTPDDPDWEAPAREGLRAHVDMAVAAISAW